MNDDRIVAGLRCGEVLEGLPAYLDEEIDGDRRSRIEAHLKGCDWCEKFGGEYRMAVEAIRNRLTAELEPSVAARKRLRDRLQSELES